MEAEASRFESSEMLAAFLGSTRVLPEAWRLCRAAYTMAQGGCFAVEQEGDVGYVAFSGVQSVTVTGLDSDENALVPIDPSLFSPIVATEDPPMVHAAFLHFFLSVYNTPRFQTQIVTLLEKSKAIIVTGHSIGGTTASLTALWLLSYLQSHSSNLSILCITFGSPLLGNSSLSRAILRERWGGKFCHVVSQHDIVPRLLFSPITPIAPHLNSLFQLWLMSMTSLHQFPHFQATKLSHQDILELYRYVLDHVAAAAMSQEDSTRTYRPFGSYLLCSKEGAICLDNATAVMQMLYLMFVDGGEDLSIDEHLKYGEVVMRGHHSLQFLKQRCSTHAGVSNSSYDEGISLALEALGISNQDESVVRLQQAKECLMKARQMGRTPNLNSANLAIRLAKITPYRAQIEWFKACCDESIDNMGYYDTFKLVGASKRIAKVNMNRIKLANFWDDVIQMLETNQLPYDFNKRAKFVNASHFYQLLVEPLDIAHYYRLGTHRTKGHYLTHGRERRYEVFDRWWRGRSWSTGNDGAAKKRSKHAGVTQDSCFWARVEEAREWVESAQRESDAGKFAQICDNILKFEEYATKLVESKEVSIDVIATNSSYTLWLKDLKELKSRFVKSHLQFPKILGDQMVL
ncbi:hypothetical protein Sjap_021633 [Stephania japonica]|uniref:Lipase-like PAD4 n=1 Tax=Stephania japonica TaxID=461633 RepID=A0AAP0HTN3_9MAGN